MRKLRFMPTIICVAILAVVIAAASLQPVSNKETRASQMDISTPDSSQTEQVINLGKNENEQELRGVWVTYMDLNLDDEKRSEMDFTDKFSKIADNCKNSGFNTLIVQVRPFGDALYKSDIFPSSHIITGKQGENCNYDPLEIMCRICREKGLSIHAWVNPYRVKLNETPNSLSSDNPYIKNKSLGVETENGIYYNPALPEVRNLIVQGVCEIVSKYDVDGIQFDDYFYPTEDESFDKNEYNDYKSNTENPMNLQEWRKSNVNIMVAQCYLELHKTKNDIAFGISPQGNIENNNSLGADVESWCKEAGYIDYICPQLYYSLENPALSFEDAVNQWIDLEYSGFCDLYIGLAGYKAGSEESDEGTWKNHNDILKQEVEFIRKYGQIKGFMLYSYESLLNDDAKEEIENVISILN